MQLSFRRIVLGSVFLGTFAVLYGLPSEGSGHPYLDLLDLPALRDLQEQEDRRMRELLVRREAVLAREAAKRAVAADLAAGRLCLPEAGARVLALDAADTDWMRQARLRKTATDSAEVCACREVIEEVRLLLGGRPECDAVVGRLEGELECRLCSQELRRPGVEAKEARP